MSTPWPMLSLDSIVAGVVAAGFTAHVDHAGGNTAIIYAGPTRPNEIDGEPDWYTVSAGPGWFDGRSAANDGRGQAWAYTDEFNVGPDRDPDTIGFEDMISPTDEDEAVEAILQVLAVAEVGPS